MKKTTKTIWVNPVPRISVQGRDKRVYTMNTNLISGDSGSLVPTTRLNKNKEFGAAETFQFPLDPLRNKLVTGLDETVDNPYKGFTGREIITNYNLDTSWTDIIEKIADQEYITKQTMLEIKHGVANNYYHGHVQYHMGNMPQDISLFHNNRSFLQDLKLVLYDRPNPFDDSSPRQELLMYMVYSLPTVAQSKIDINPAIHNWFISQENEEEELAAKKAEIIEEAIYHMHKLKHEYGKFRSYQMAIVLSDSYNQSLVKGKVTNEVVSSKLSSYIQEKSNNQMTNISTFMKNINLLKSKEGFSKFFIKYLIQQALNTNVLALRDNEYIWHSKAGTPDVYKLGNSYDKLINFFVKEYEEYNPKSDISNWYKDLSEEVAAKGIQLDE